MGLNLITDRWIPVRYVGENDVRLIAPWEIADKGVLSPAWGRPDFDMACYEFLIGLLFLACPPVDEADRVAKQEMSSEELKAHFLPYAPAFNMTGTGPIFMQENGLDKKSQPKDVKPLDGLLLNGAGGQAIRQNTDVIVHRNQLEQVSLSYAAMLLYTLQTYAPSGGSGNRTSLRGGGPLTVLLKSRKGSLRDTLWLNVPFGEPSEISVLPWMKAKPMTSEKGQFHHCPDERGFTAEAFFGMPRRIFLITKDDHVVNFVQRPYGINYGRWRHPLSPYYKMKPKDDWMARHPRPKPFFYDEYLGVIMLDEAFDDLFALSQNMREWLAGERATDRNQALEAIVAGWSMNNMFPRYYARATVPLFHMDDDSWNTLIRMTYAGRMAGNFLKHSLYELLGNGSSRDALIEEFFVRTGRKYKKIQAAILAGESPEEEWRNHLMREAMSIFKETSRSGLPTRSMPMIEKITTAQTMLSLQLRGWGKTGREFFDTLGLPHPVKKTEGRKNYDN